MKRPFLLQQSQARILRSVAMPATRGMILDRHGEPLAVSTPVSSIWINPKHFHASAAQLSALASLTGVPETTIAATGNQKKSHFVYLRRRLPPLVGKQVRSLAIPGVYTQKEYRRYYPTGAVSAQVVGLTNVDDRGQEGLELEYNRLLTGVPGRKEVIRDRLGHVITNIAVLKPPKQGQNVVLGLDQRIQFMAFHVLKDTVSHFHAKSGSVVVLDTKTGEILAMANMPSYNPNKRPKAHDARFRNRADTDAFEPGSTIKPFNVALALSSGRYTPDSTIDTNPGYIVVDGHTIRDDGLNYGVITLTQLLQKSSNVGAAKLLFSLSPQRYWDLLAALGFGERPGTGFPGETPGSLPFQTRWSPVEVASLAFGYGVSVSTLQLAKAYAVIANHGVKHDVTFLKRARPQHASQVIDATVADTVLHMMQSVVASGGTGRRAAVPGYHIAGKTGTAYIAGPKGYDKKNPHYMSSFVGIAPVSHPRLVIAVMVRDPQGQHFGGLVAAPAFKSVMASALRLLNIPPDALKPVSNVSKA